MVASRFTEAVGVVGFLALTGIAGWLLNFRKKFYTLMGFTIIILLVIFGFSFYTWAKLEDTEEDEKIKYLTEQLIWISGVSAVMVGIFGFLTWKLNLQGQYTYSGDLDSIDRQVRAQKNYESKKAAVSEAKVGLAKAKTEFSEASEERKSSIKESGRGSSKSDSSSSTITERPTTTFKFP